MSAKSQADTAVTWHSFIEENTVQKCQHWWLILSVVQALEHCPHMCPGALSDVSPWESYPCGQSVVIQTPPDGVGIFSGTAGLRNSWRLWH